MDVLDMTTKIVPISDLRRQSGRIVRAVQEDGDVVYVTRYGRPAVVLVGYEQYEELLSCREEPVLNLSPAHFPKHQAQSGTTYYFVKNFLKTHCLQPNLSKYLSTPHPFCRN